MKKIIRQKKKYNRTIEVKNKLSEKVDLDDFQKLEKRLIKSERIILTKI